MKKKVLAMMLSMAMVAGALAGCGNDAPAAESKAPESSAAKTESSAAPEAETPSEPIEIKWLGYYTSALNVAENSWAENLIEEYCNTELGMNIDLIGVSTINAENKDTYIASGEILDVTCYTNYIMSDYEFMWEQGLIREFPNEWLEEYYPTGMALMRQYLGDEYYDNHKNQVMLDGELRTINNPWIEGTTFSHQVVLYRKDWADNLGIEEPKSLTEVYDMLYAFTYDDPDGNGQDDTYGMDPIYSNRGFLPIFSALNVAPTVKVYQWQEDGTVIHNATTDAYKQALTIIKEWYDAGIVDPECLTDDRSMQRQKWANGTIGMLVDSETWYYSERGASNLVALAESTFGEGTVDVLGEFSTEYKGETLGDGKLYTFHNYFTDRSHGSMYFTKDATDEQVIAVLKILEAMTVDHDLFTKIKYGEEGIDYDIIDGAVVTKPEITVEQKAAKGIDMTFFGYGIMDDYMLNVCASERDKELKAQTWPNTSNYHLGNNFSVGSTEASTLYAAEVNKVIDEYYANVLLGADSLDNWDAYLAKLDAAGLQEVCKSYEEVLNK